MKVYIVRYFHACDSYDDYDASYCEETIEKIFDREEKAKLYIIDELKGMKREGIISLDTIPTVDEIKESQDIVYVKTNFDEFGYNYVSFEVE